MKTSLIVVLFYLTLAFSAPIGQMIDLTYPFDNSTVYVNTHKPWKLTTMKRGPDPRGFWVYLNEFGPTNEHGGTHMDAPAHFGPNYATIDQIPLENLVGKGFVIDITNKTINNDDAELERADIINYENKYGLIPEKGVVIMRTGWESRWGNRTAFLNFDAEGKPHFPGIHQDAARLLVERKINGVGVDTASLDAAVRAAHESHQILMGAGIWGIEMVANVTRLPPKGFTVYTLPTKAVGGSGGPSRVFATIDRS